MSENGKGDKPRPKDTDKWDDGWKSIKWDKPKDNKKQGKEKAANEANNPRISA